MRMVPYVIRYHPVRGHDSPPSLSRLDDRNRQGDGPLLQRYTGAYFALLHYRVACGISEDDPRFSQSDLQAWEPAELSPRLRITFRTPPDWITAIVMRFIGMKDSISDVREITGSKQARDEMRAGRTNK